MRHQTHLEHRELPRKTVVDILGMAAVRRPGEVAIRFVGEDGVEPTTYHQLWQSARSVAARLRGDGLVEGDRVLLILPTGRPFVEHFFGVLMAGGIPVPLAPPASLVKLEAWRETLRAIA